MQAVILAAGMGTRMGLMTEHQTKCMVEVNGTRLIDRMMDQISANGLKRVVVIVGYQAEGLKAYLTDRYGTTLDIKYIDNDKYWCTNNIYSMILAQDELKSDDSLILESDLILDNGLMEKMVNDPAPNSAMVAKYEAWMDGTLVKINDENNITHFIRPTDLTYDEKSMYHKTVNIYKLSREFSELYYCPQLRNYCCLNGYSDYYEQAFKPNSHASIKAVYTGESRWAEIDDCIDLHKAELMFRAKGA